MKYFISTLLFFLVKETASQELRVSMDYGYAIAEMKQTKKFMLQTGVKGVAEFNISYSLSITVGVGGSLLQHSYTNTSGESVFNKKYFLVLPVSLKKYYPFSKRSAGFIDACIYAANLMLDKNEIRYLAGTRSSREKNTGWNAGGVMNIGFKTMITSTLSFDIGLASKRDFLHSYKQDQDWILTKGTALVISFYRKL